MLNESTSNMIIRAGENLAVVLFDSEWQSEFNFLNKATGEVVAWFVSGKHIHGRCHCMDHRHYWCGDPSDMLRSACVYALEKTIFGRCTPDHAWKYRNAINRWELDHDDTWADCVPTEYIC